MNEVKWLDVPGYDGRYQVSSLGQVKLVPKNILITAHPCHGYLQLTLRRGKRNYKKEYLHRIVAQTFIPNPLNKPEINHKNAIRNDNRIENLEWCTRKENAQHAIRVGHRIKKGAHYWDPANRLCPICRKQGLYDIYKYAIEKTDVIVCSNEDYIHVRRGGRHFLAKTAKNILEEIERPGQLVLN